MRVPPNVSVSDFTAAIKEFQSVVGSDWVFTSDADLNVYRDAYSPYLGEPEERIASAAVAPNTTEQVQSVVRIANKYHIPIYPISTGKNLGYGGSAPGYSGSVVLDLKRMNRILEISERNAYVLVEPGVSYFDLYRHIQERGLKLWVDVPDPGWGSLIGNALEHGSGYTLPHLRNHFEAHCGMEVVLANGEVMRTGMGALPAAQTWQQYKSGYGPWVDGLFLQSNFGVVTKMGFWLMPEPDAVLKGQIQLPRYKDLVEFVDILNYLENSGVYNGTPDFGSPLLFMPQIAQWPEFIEGAAPTLDPGHAALLQKAEFGYSPELEAYGLKHNIPYWRCSLTFYGPAKAVLAQWEFAKEKCRAIAGVTFEDGEVVRPPLTAEQRKQIHLPEFGIPSLNNFVFGARSKLNPHPAHGHMWFSPIIPRTGEAIYTANKVFMQTAKEFDIPLQFSFMMPTCYWERAFVCIFGFSITEDAASNKKHRELFRELIKRCAAHGWGEYRTSTVFQDDVAQEYSFNNYVLRRFSESIKDAVDPNGILSPGRYGIWPKHLRDGRK
jgi:(+)-pinoresinol hydroxylase